MEEVYRYTTVDYAYTPIYSWIYKGRRKSLKVKYKNPILVEGRLFLFLYLGYEHHMKLIVVPAQTEI
jgi:hypothetical protein